MGQVPQPTIPVNQESLANLIEQMYGPRLQRVNRPLYRKPYLEYIDRALANVEWRTQFPEALVLHHPRTHSDHHPLLILLEGLTSIPLCKPFRFELAWTTHPHTGGGSA